MNVVTQNDWFVILVVQVFLRGRANCGRQVVCYPLTNS